MGQVVEIAPVPSELPSENVVGEESEGLHLQNEADEEEQPNASEVGQVEQQQVCAF